MLLLTGATGLVGSAVLRRLVAEGRAVRCLVRDPRRLAEMRVQVQIALGDLSDPRSFRNAMRGVDTVAHLATTTRDQRGGSVEELTAMATWKMVRAAQAAGVERFVLLSALGASTHHPARLLRAKAVAERALAGSPLRSTVLATSFVYAPHDRWLSLIERLAALPAVPVPGSGDAHCQPIWVEDVAACVSAVLRSSRSPSAIQDRPAQARSSHERSSRANGADAVKEHVRYELAGPDTLTYDEVIRTVLRRAGRQRPLVHMPAPVARRILHALERAAAQDAPLTWDEAQLLQADAISARGTADARALGVEPRSISSVLGLS